MVIPCTMLTLSMERLSHEQFLLVSHQTCKTERINPASVNIDPSQYLNCVRSMVTFTDDGDCANV